MTVEKIVPTAEMISVYILGLWKEGKRVEWAHCSPGVWASLKQDEYMKFNDYEFHGARSVCIMSVHIICDPFFQDGIIAFYPCLASIDNLESLTI